MQYRTGGGLRTRAGVATLLILGLVLASAPALAGPTWDTEPTTPAAMDDLARGRVAYKLQKWEEAIAAFEAGARAEPNLPIWLWTLGQTHRQAGHYEQAKWYYERFVAEMQGDENSGEAVAHARQFIKDMDAAAKREPRGLPPDMPRVAAGPRFESAQPVRWYQDSTGWVLAGAGALCLATGAGVGLHASSLNDQAERESNFTERARLRDAASSQGSIAVIAAGVGVLLVGAATVKLAIVPTTSTGRGVARLVPGPGNAGLALFLEF